ncbi:YbjN domain-containing protein [Ursidibacter maritimus]|uniref:YbjN domain-containing protein n=1 Tax=Ursidibacter maritimus TaxID=1331689 RepID=UPI001C46E6E9|nr:YbjN domain-containing protein [Ursidibacter maritimus]MBV6540377.1 YbjN domain-containing protein [Ursidibacter maritimus]
MNNWQDWLRDGDDNSEFVEVKKSYSDQELITLLKNEGYSPVKRIKEGAIFFQADGSNYILFNQQDTLQIVIMFNDAQHIEYEELNEWNSNHRFSRAYINEDNGVVVLDNDLDLKAGVSEQQIIRFIGKFQLLAGLFKEKM